MYKEWIYDIRNNRRKAPTKEELMKKRVLSLCMAFVLSFSMMPMTAFAEGTDAVTEQQETQGSELPGTVDTTDGSATVEDISGGNAGTKDAEMEAVQALIDALPEEVTADNADGLRAQLMAIYEALAALDEAQTARLNMTRLENVSAALNVAVAAQAGEHKHAICGKTCTCTDTTHYDGQIWTAINTEEDLKNVSAYKYYYLNTDIELTKTWEITVDKIYICLNGHDIIGPNGSDTIIVNKQLRLVDCKGDSTDGEYGKITHNSGENGRGVKVNEGGILYMYSGAISGNTVVGSDTTSAAGGGVWFNGKFYMYGGEISGNTVKKGSKGSANGGGVFVDGGTFEMTGGEISKNTAESEGGGVYTRRFTTFNMKGGTIGGESESDANTAPKGGGVNVYISYFNMSGGTISNNKGTDGGGVYVYFLDCNNNMTGGEISRNTAESGGGVYVYGDGASYNRTFKISNVKISNNKATDGGGIYVNSTIEMYDNAIISGNEATQKGGGVYASGTLKMYGGEISENIAEGEGGGIANINGYVTMTGGEIAQNKGTSGGGVYAKKSFTMSGGKISNNEATTGDGGGVCQTGGSGHFKMSGGEISNNTAAGSGGGVQAGGYVLLMSGDAKISGNTAAVNGGGVNVSGSYGLGVAGAASVLGNSCNGKVNNVDLLSGKNIQITGELTGIKSIGVTLPTLPTAEKNSVVFANGYNSGAFSGYNSYSVNESDAAAFSIDGYEDDTNYNVRYGGDNLKLYYGKVHRHTVCVGTNCTDSHAEVIWEPIGDETALRDIDTTKGKYYYLTGDIELTGDNPWYPANGVVLDLCGHSIIGDLSYVIQSYKNVTFTLTDCKGDTGNYGKITHLEGGEGGPGIYVDQGTNFHFYGGCITGNNSTSGVVNVLGNFYMYGGEIKDNADTSTSNSEAAVYVQECGSFDMSGGKITGNSIARGCGGVYVNGAITVSGDAQITGNQENGKTSNVYLKNGKSITVSGALSEFARIGVTSADVPNDSNSVNIATATTDNWIKDGNFITDSSLYKVTVSEGGKTANLGLHDHQWGVKTLYVSNRLQECCILEGCKSITPGTLILTALDQKYSGASYDAASYNKTGDWNHDPIVGEYYYTNSEGKEIPAPVNVGTYNVNLDVDGVTATQKFEITAENLYSGDFTFQGPENLTYDGSPKEATVTVVPGKADASGSVTVKYYKGDAQVTNPTEAGTYTVKIDVTAGTGYKEGSNITDSTWKFTIAPKSVTITSISAQNKEYDGNTDAVITGMAEISGLVTGDENDVMVNATSAKAAFADADAGTAKTVTFNGYALTGTKAGNYTLSAQPASVTADITPKELTIAGVTVEDKDYDGTKTATVTGVTFAGLVNRESLTEGKDYTVTGNFADAAVGADKEVTVKVELADSVKNYTLSGTEYKKSGCKISKATVAAPAATNLTIINGSTTIYTVMLPQLLPSPVSPGEYGSLTYEKPTLNITDSSYHGTAEVRGGIEDGKLALKFTDTGTTEGSIGTITVTVHSDNYQDITLTINILATAKIVPQLEGTLKLTPSEITYGEKLSNITISGTMTANGREITGTFAWQNPDDVLNAGNQQAAWKFTPEDTQTYAETSDTTMVKVNQAEQSGVVSMDNYTYNETPKTPDLTDRKGDLNAAVTYYYSTTRTNSGGTEWKNIGPTTLKAGTYYMYAVIGETGNFNKYTTEAKAFTVWTAEPAYTKPSGLTAKYGQKLSEITLPKPAGNMSGTWSWEAPDTVIDKTGKVSYDAVFTPDDKNYKEVADTIEITVTPGDGRNLATEELTLAFNDSTDHTYTPDWSGLPAGQTWSYNCESSISNGSKATLTKLNVSAANGELTYAVSGGKACDEITVILKAQCNNYKDFTITLNIKITKAMPTGAPKYTLITTEGKILADAGLTLTGSTLKPAEGKLEWMDEAENVLTDDTEVKVNTTYWWRFTPTDTNYDPLTGKVELYHVDAPAISAQPKSVSVITGERAIFEVTATGTDVTYQWKIDRNDGNGFTDIPGATGAAYTTGVTDKDCDGFKYQCVIRNAAGAITTDTVVLTVKEKYTITAAAGAHGSISPSGNVEVVEGSSQTFVITAEEGYEIESLTVDGTAVSAVADYTFENVTAAHTIAVTFKQQYKIIDGANSSWTQSTDGSGSIRIRGNGEISKFVNVKVDGTIVDPANYTVTEGSTIIELKADYLKTLSEGTHTFEIIWTDGTAGTSFTVAKNTSDAPGNDDNNKDDNNDNNGNGNDSNDGSNNGSSNTAGSDNTVVQILDGSPNTGDASGIWIALFVVSAAGLAAMLVRRKNSIKK